NSGSMFWSQNLADVRAQEISLLNRLGRHDEALNLSIDLLRQGQPILTKAGAQGATDTLGSQMRSDQSYVKSVGRLLDVAPSLDRDARRETAAAVLHVLADDVARSGGPASTARGLLQGKAYGGRIDALARDVGLEPLASALRWTSVGDGDKAG